MHKKEEERKHLDTSYMRCFAYTYSTGITLIFASHWFLMCTASQMGSMASRPRCVILAFFLLLTLASAIRSGSDPEEKLVCLMWKNEYRRKCSDSSTGLRCRVLLGKLQANGCDPSELILTNVFNFFNEQIKFGLLTFHLVNIFCNRF